MTSEEESDMITEERCCTTGFKDGGGREKPKIVGRLKELEEARDGFFPGNTTRSSSMTPWLQPSGTDVQTSDLHNYKRINLSGHALWCQ